MGIERINLIGAGNVAKALYKSLAGKVQVQSVYSRSGSSKEFFSNSEVVNDLNELRENVDLNIIAISDDSILEVANKLPAGIPTVHTSGATDISVLNGIHDCGVIYPLQTFSKRSEPRMKDVPLLIEGNSLKFVQLLEDFCSENLSTKYHIVSSKIRLEVHLAAVFANNFTNFFLSVSAEILAKNNLSIDLLEPLMQETIRKAIDLGPENSQTGPAYRNDANTIKKHLDLIEDQKLEALYRIISESITEKFKI